MTQIRRITLLTNPDACNLHCPLCFLNQRNVRFSEISGVGGEMGLDVAKAAIERYGSFCDAHGARILREVIPSTMGEPLLYSHFEEILDFCRTLKIPMNLTTNGTFPGKWGGTASLSKLLLSCSDIKISSLAAECFDGWKSNAEKMVALRKDLQKCQEKESVTTLATVSIQATLHGRNLMMIPELIAWASAVGIDRIKWNKVVFLSETPDNLKEHFALNRTDDELREYIEGCAKLCGSSVSNGGSLFMNPPGISFREEFGNCPFAEEVWILPDGSEQHCPHPERRFGNNNSAEAKCCFIQ